MMKMFIFSLFLLFTFSVGAFAVDIGSGNDDKTSYEDVLQKTDVQAVAANLNIVNLDSDILIRAVPISFAEHKVFKMTAVSFRVTKFSYYKRYYSICDADKPNNNSLSSKQIPPTIRNSI